MSDGARIDVDELRVRLQEETEAALALSDELCAEIARVPSSDEAARLAANYLQIRALLRRLRRVLAVEVAG